MKANNPASNNLPAATPDSTRQQDLWLGALIIGDAVLSIAPVIILGAAIGWPESLGKPAAEQLAAIHANTGAVTLGYGLYLLYSLLIAPVMIGLARRVFGGLGRALPAIVVAFAVLSTLSRAIGILRWLTVMPALAVLYANTPANATGEAARAQIELIFSAITSYGGGIGEILGVSLFMALSLSALCIGSLFRGGMPTWLAWSGLASAVLLGALAAPTFGAPSFVPVAAAVSVLSAWMLGVGVWCVLPSRNT